MILKIVIGLIFGLAVISYVHDPAQAKALAGIIAELLFSIGSAVRHALMAVIETIK
ncbi:hypothetical protein [Elioraea sp.]|uniref:hypothetical protein n=1 Tax=Elioraea sp. TaxID=2185103 RepID=UPI00307D8332